MDCNRKPEILVVGSYVMDFIVSTKRFAQTGETVIGSGFSTASGGKGANQAVQAARLGASVTMVGKVGRDCYGVQMLESLKQSGVDVSKTNIDETVPSAIGNVQLQIEEDQVSNRIIVVPGANMTIGLSDVAFLEEEIGRFDMVILQNEIPMEINETVAEYAHNKGVPVMLNPAPSAEISEKLLSCLSYICPNEHEAFDLTGVEIRDTQSAKEAIARLNQRKIAHVLITLGNQGAVFGNRDVFIKSPCIPVEEVRDPTAAGDSFIGAFCTAVCIGMTYKEALQFANCTAAITVSKMGAQPSLPKIQEVKAFMEKQHLDTEKLKILQ